MKLPTEILASILLRKANISKEERMLVLTGMNYHNRSCGSYRHLVADCPDSWENMAKVNITVKEHVVFVYWLQQTRFITTGC